MADTEPSSLIRVALRIASDPVPAFLAAASSAVLETAGASVVLILVSAPTEVRATIRQRVSRSFDTAYAWLERRLLPGGPASLTTQHMSPLPVGMRILHPASAESERAALRDCMADVVIDLGPPSDPDSSSIPPLGWWRLRYSAGVGEARGPIVTRPRKPVVLAESLLSITLASGHEVETELGVSTLRRVGFGRDRDAILWRSALLPARRLARQVGGEVIPTSVLDRPMASVAVRSEAARSPAAPPIIGLALTVARKLLDRLLFPSSWVVLVRVRDHGAGPPHDLAGFEPVVAPAGRFYADPFVVEMPDGPRLYVEDCPDGAHRGRISILRAKDGRHWALERVAVEDGGHRAYPHVLRTDSGLLVTPDGGRRGGVDLFIDHGADHGLAHIGVCIPGVPASDPTIIRHAGRYWLFVAVTGHGMSPWDELHLYSAAEFADAWEPHPQNPIVADVRRARPAGRIFAHRDTLIRPGQDCSTEYGRRIVLSAITTLSTSAYEEDVIGSIEPKGSAGIHRTHTYTFDGSIEALDGYRRRRRTFGRRRSEP